MEGYWGERSSSCSIGYSHRRVKGLWVGWQFGFVLRGGVAWIRDRCPRHGISAYVEWRHGSGGNAGSDAVTSSRNGFPRWMVSDPVLPPWVSAIGTNGNRGNQSDPAGG